MVLERLVVPARAGKSQLVWLEALDDRSSRHGQVLDLTRAEERQYFLVHSGGGEAELDGWRTALRPGEVLFVPSRTVGRMTIAPGSRIFWFCVADSFLISRVLPALGVSFASWSAEFPMPRKLSHWSKPEDAGERDRLWLELTLAARRLGGTGDAAIAAYVLLTLFEKYNFPLKPEAALELEETVTTLNEASAPNAEVALVIRFRSLIERHLADQWKVQDYCNALQVRAAELGDACKNVVGETPSVLIRERLLLDAKRHLAFSRMPAAQIAYRLGFTDAAYFSRYFKKQTGQSPLEFRRSRRPIFAAGASLAS